MARRYKSQQRRKIILSRVGVLVLIVLIFVLIRAVWNVYTKERETRERLSEVRAEHAELSEREAFLETEIERLSTESGVEDEIRRQYGLAREGERVFVITDRMDAEATSTKKGFWDFLFFWRD